MKTPQIKSVMVLCYPAATLFQLIIC